MFIKLPFKLTEFDTTQWLSYLQDSINCSLLLVLKFKPHTFITFKSIVVICFIINNLVIERSIFISANNNTYHDFKVNGYIFTAAAVLSKYISYFVRSDSLTKIICPLGVISFVTVYIPILKEVCGGVGEGVERRYAGKQIWTHISCQPFWDGTNNLPFCCVHYPTGKHILYLFAPYS